MRIKRPDGDILVAPALHEASGKIKICGSNIPCEKAPLLDISSFCKGRELVGMFKDKGDRLEMIKARDIPLLGKDSQVMKDSGDIFLCFNIRDVISVRRDGINRIDRVTVKSGKDTICVDIAMLSRPDSIDHGEIFLVKSNHPVKTESGAVLEDSEIEQLTSEKDMWLSEGSYGIPEEKDSYELI